MNVKLKEGFEQVCIWPGCIVTDKDTSEKNQDRINEFEQFMLDEFKTHVQYLEEIKTKPDYDGNHNPVEGTGKRNDLFFAVHLDDIGKFAVPRLTMNIRWIEDVLATCNYKQKIYPTRIFKYVSWNKKEIKFPNLFPIPS